MQYNSEKCACNFCLQGGKKTSKGIRYIYEDRMHTRLRTHDSMMEDIARVNSKPGTVTHGIKGVSLSFANSFTIDYMHAVLLGITRNLIFFWTDSCFNKKPFYITKSKKKLLNSRLLRIKTTTYLSRRPRSLDHFKNFKSSEFRSLLLYFLPICLERLLPLKYIKHFRLLSSSIYILLKPTISNDELEEVEKTLERFVINYQVYYGKENMTMNIHQLLHLVDCVRNFGPLWTFSMFPFEAYNGLLKSFIVAPTDILHQLTMRYVGYKTVNLKKDSGERLHSAELKYETEMALEACHIEAIEVADIIPAGGGNMKFYTCFEKNGVKFTSRMYMRAINTANYFVETVHGLVGVVVFYFTCNYHQYVMLEILDVLEVEEQFKKIKFKEEYLVIKADQIIEQYMHIEVLKCHYIVKRPNPFERN